MPLVSASGLRYLAAVYSRQKQFIRAEPLLTRCLLIAEKELGPAATETALCLQDLVAVQLSLGRTGDAEQLSRRAIAVIDTQSVPATAWIELLRIHAQVLKRMKRKQEAAEVERGVESLLNLRPTKRHTIDVTDFNRSSRRTQPQE